MKVGLEHEDAPVLLKYTIGEFRRLLAPFRNVEIVPERFPVQSRLHGGTVETGEPRQEAVKAFTSKRAF